MVSITGGTEIRSSAQSIMSKYSNVSKFGFAGAREYFYIIYTGVPKNWPSGKRLKLSNLVNSVVDGP